MPQAFIEQFFSLISNLNASQSGGTASISAGMIQTIVPVFNNRRAAQHKNVMKCIQILDNLIYGFTNSFNPFVNANGLDVLVGRVNNEVDSIVEDFSSTGNGLFFKFDSSNMFPKNIQNRPQIMICQAHSGKELCRHIAKPLTMMTTRSPHEAVSIQLKMIKRGTAINPLKMT